MKAKKIASLLLAVLMLVSMLALPVSATEAVAAAEVVVSDEAALREAIKNGETNIKLGANIELSYMLRLSVPGLTLNGAGKTITAGDGFTADNDPENTGQSTLVKIVDESNSVGVSGVKVENLKIVGTEKTQHTLDVWGSEKVVLENVELDHTRSAVNGAPLVINGSDVTVQEEFTVTAGAKSWYGINVDSSTLTFANSAKATFNNIANSIYKFEIAAQGTEYSVKGFESLGLAEVRGNGGAVYVPAVVKVNGEYEGEKYEYTSAILEEAIVGTSNSDVVTLLKDIEISAPLEVYTGFILDLNGHTIENITSGGNSGDWVIKVIGGDTSTTQTLTITDSSEAGTGTIKGKYGVTVQSGAELVLEKGNIVSTAANGIAFRVWGASASVNGGTIDAEYQGVVLYSNGDVPGKFNMEAGKVSANQDAALIVNGSADYDDCAATITGGELSSATDTAIYWPATGKLTIADAKVSGYTAAYVKSGSLEIKSGEFIGNGPKADYVFNGNGCDPTGDAIMIENVDNSGYEGINPVIISGGTFTSVNGSTVASYAAVTQNPQVVRLTGFITGGKFNKAPTSELIAKDYECIESGNMYVVGEHKPVTVPAKAPTCTAEGNLEYTYCETCKVYVVKDMGAATVAPILPKLDHVPEAARVGVVPATHEAAGYTGDVVCACGELLIKGEATPKLEAEVAAPVVDEEAHKTVTDEVQNVVAAINGGANPDEVKTLVTEETKAAVEEAYAAGAAAGKEVVIGADIVAQPIQEEKIEKKEVEAIEEKAAALAKDDEEVVIASYLDISVLVVNRSNDNKVLGKITELEKPVEIQIVVPESLRTEGAKYVVVRYHDGKAEIIEGEYKDGVLTIKTDKFSTYALAVVTMPTSGEGGATEDEKEEDKEEEPTASPSPSTEPTATPAPTTAPTATPAPTAAPTATAAPTKAPSDVPATGDESNVFALCAIMAMSAAAAYIVLKKFRKA